MKSMHFVINILFLILSIIMTFIYHVFGGIELKAVAALVFVSLCFINMIYIIKNLTDKKRFSIIIFLGQLVCMIGDIVLWYDFIIGAIIFGIGHVFYIVAYSYIEKYNKKDILPCIVLAIISISIIIFVPVFDYGMAIMEIVCVVYGLIISIMVGKAFSNYIYHRTIAQGLILLGSILFYISDLMLLFYMFAGASPITDVICLFTYFPGQCILAHSLYHITKE